MLWAITDWLFRFSNDNISELINPKITPIDSRISPKNTKISPIDSRISSKNKPGKQMLGTEVSHVVQVRAEGPKAPSPGHRPGYNGNQQGAL